MPGQVEFGSFAFMMPGMDDLGGGDHYWTIEEVQAETNRLAEQLAAMKC